MVTTKPNVYIWNPKQECQSKEELSRLQLDRLKNLLENVYNKSSFYKNKLDEAKIDPTKFNSLDDLKCLPFTKKTDLRENYPFGLFSEPIDNVRRLHASSGTKGKPTVVGYTDKDISTWSEICARSLATAGVKPKDIVHNAYGYGLFTGGLGMHYGIENLGATVVPASGGRTQQQILLLQDFGARVLLSTPSYALNIAHVMEENGIKRDSIKLEIGIFGAEPWTEELRSQIENTLKIKALDIYGLSEVMGPGVSMECIDGRNGLHVWEDIFLPEIIDPDTQEPLADGCEGELVFTTLVKEAIPVIRYRTGDISRLTREPCICGRTMVKMERVKARLDDMLIIRGVNLFPSEIEKCLLVNKELAPHYQLIVNRVKALDVLEVQIEVTEKFHNSCSDEESKALVNNIKRALKDSLGLTASIKLMDPSSVPRSEGKAVRVIDNRTQNC